MKFTVLVVDDEIRARELLKTRISEDSELELIGECKTGSEALEAIRDKEPDLVFLDIHMPDGSGIDVLKKLGEKRLHPVVVMVTAYDQYAVQAFEYYALDYLLKPFHRSRFEKAVARAKDRIRSSHTLDRKDNTRELLAYLEQLSLPLRSDAESATRQPYVKRLIVTRSGLLASVPVTDIDWIEADDHYIRIHGGGKTHLTQAKISDLEARLDPRQFQRVHRSTIVNLSAIKNVKTAPYGSMILTMNDNSKLRVSRSYREKLKYSLLRVN